MGLICTRKCCIRHHAGSSGQVNISPGHHSSGPILKLRRCGGIPWLERVFIVVIFIAAARQRTISWSFPVWSCNVPRIRSRTAEAWQCLCTEEAAEQSCRMLLVGTFPWIWLASPSDMQHPGVGGRCRCGAQNASGSAQDRHQLSVPEQASLGRAG